MKFKQDPDCGIPGHYAWTVVTGRRILFWRMPARVRCLRCYLREKGTKP